MTPLRRHMLTCLIASALSLLAMPSLGEPPTAPDENEQYTPATDPAIDHIRKLEQMLRDAGIDPPARPAALPQDEFNLGSRILPRTLEKGPLRREALAINRGGKDAVAALNRVRMMSKKGDPDKKPAADAILAAMKVWVDGVTKQIKKTEAKDPIAAYILADDALQIVFRDPLGDGLRAYVRMLQEDRKNWRHIESMAAYRRVMRLAESIGLTGDWALMDFSDREVRETIQQIAAKLKLIRNNWGGSIAAQAADAHLKDWAEREKQLAADLPKWRYTWQINFIRIGTDTTTRITKDIYGEILITEEEEAVYDRTQVILQGSFQNTSDKPYRYSFVVGVSTQGGKRWTGDTKRMAGWELVETPTLRPGQIYNWQVELSVKNVFKLRRGGISNVKAIAPGR